MRGFDYVKPRDIQEAIEELSTKERPRPLAGGTDLIVGMKERLIEADCLVDLKGLPGLNSIEQDQDGFRIGALTTMRDIEKSSLIREKLGTLSEAAATVGSVQVRNRATVGGNLCHASPSADLAAILLAMDAQVRIASPRGERNMPLEGFFTGPKCTALEKDEILCEILIPKNAEGLKGLYLKHGPRKAMDIGIVNIVVFVRGDGNKRPCREIRIGMGAVAPTPMRARKAESLLKGSDIQSHHIEEVAAVAAREAKPITDFRASAVYRKELIRSLIMKGLSQLLENS